jgi:hypothetical protein
VNWIHLAQDGLVMGSCEHGNKVLLSIKGNFLLVVGLLASEEELNSMELIMENKIISKTEVKTGNTLNLVVSVFFFLQLTC